MTWTYHPFKNELVVTYGLDGRSATKTVSGGSWVTMDLDETGALMRVSIRAATRICPIEVLQSLYQPAVFGEKPYLIPEAAAKLGVKSYVLRREILEGGMPAAKNINAWQVRECFLDLCREIFAARRHLADEQFKD